MTVENNIRINRKKKKNKKEKTKEKSLDRLNNKGNKLAKRKF